MSTSRDIAQLRAWSQSRRHELRKLRAKVAADARESRRLGAKRASEFLAELPEAGRRLAFEAVVDQHDAAIDALARNLASSDPAQFSAWAVFLRALRENARKSRASRRAAARRRKPEVPS